MMGAELATGDAVLVVPLLTGDCDGLRVEGAVVTTGLSETGPVVGPDEGRLDGILDWNVVGVREGPVDGF